MFPPHLLLTRHSLLMVLCSLILLFIGLLLGLYSILRLLELICLMLSTKQVSTYMLLLFLTSNLSNVFCYVKGTIAFGLTYSLPHSTNILATLMLTGPDVWKHVALHMVTGSFLVVIWSRGVLRSNLLFLVLVVGLSIMLWLTQLLKLFGSLIFFDNYMLYLQINLLCFVIIRVLFS